MGRYLILAFLGCLIGASSEAMAAERFRCQQELAYPEGQRLLEETESQYRTVQDLSAEFVQYSYFAGLDRGEHSKGTVRFKKPGRMDWLYTDPERQRFVADGATLWYYQPSVNQVTVGEFTSAFSSELPVSFLLGIGSLAESFSLKRTCRTDGDIFFELAPLQTDPSLQAFQLLVDPETKLPVGAKTFDVGGNETQITLVAPKVDQGVKDAAFAFVPPRGVDIIDNRTAAPVRSKPIFEEDVVGQSESRSTEGKER
ncbi:MAG: outer membrane lipoprotein chaperone LolA [Bdellovibrionales bacterium]|nr:outer membrane lipoprotein chaperone LolA [Bdellovibrionales bacterium]